MRQRGFTLLELLVALAVFGALWAMAYGGLDAVLKQRVETEARAERLLALQRAFMLMGRDLEQAVPRTVRGEFGDRRPALRGTDVSLELTHAGWSNPAELHRSTLQRVAYGLEDGRLLRLSWWVLDRAQDSEPREDVLIDGIEEIRFRFRAEPQVWADEWEGGKDKPEEGERPVALPLAVEVTLVTEDWGSIVRLFRVPG